MMLLKFIKTITVLLSVLAVSTVRAEYRVYQYYIKSRYKLNHDQEGYLITSTLDPVSYLAYHGGHESLKIDLLRTWQCPGFTGDGKELCASPQAKLEGGE
jgi:hypothetical protein